MGGGSSEDPEARKKRIEALQKEAPCHICKRLGHWSRECPERGKRQPPRGAAANAAHVCLPAFVAESGRQSGQMGRLAAFMTVRECTARGEASASVGLLPVQPALVVRSEVRAETEALAASSEAYTGSVILDLGCLKSVTGVNWALRELERVKRES